MEEKTDKWENPYIGSLKITYCKCQYELEKEHN
jgi:hypothetical protein